MPVKRTSGEPSGAPKRTRFASPPPRPGPSSAGPSQADRERSDSADPSGAATGEDQFLEADITESNRAAKKRERRALKDTDGYGSDSSNEDGETVVPSRRPGAKDEGEEEDDDVDMFADEPEEKADKGKGKGKESKDKEFMDLEDVEGQEFSRNRVGPEEDSDSDEEAQEKKKLTGLDGDMGVDITPFNMKAEMESGRFTADGEAYMENDKDEGEKHDMWLDGADKDAIKKARRAHREREKLERDREAREAEVEGVGSEEREHALMREAVGLMERGETVLEALQRQGKEVEDARKKEETKAGGKKKSWAERQKERKAAMATDHADSSPFARLSDIVSGLTAIGHLDVYSLSREAIQRMLPREAEPERQAAPPAVTDNRAFQYRFSMQYLRTLPEDQRPVERELFGPFSATQLRQWKMTGFFGPDCENVELRSVTGGEEGAWGAWKDVVEA